MDRILAWMVGFIMVFHCVIPLFAENNCSTSDNREWSPWSNWSLCSKSCGVNGTRTRYRFCSLKLQKDCIASVEFRNETCNLFKCPSFDEFYSKKIWNICLFFTPTNGNWSEWQDINNCTDTCNGGIIISTRYCNNPIPMDCGNHCGPNNFLIGNCPVNGGWSAWNNSPICSKSSCGYILQTKTRECNNPAPQHNGKLCSGNPALVTGLCPFNTGCSTGFLTFSKTNNMAKQDDINTQIQFPSGFTLMDSSTLYFSSNGFVSIDRDDSIIPINMNKHSNGVIFIYNIDININYRGGGSVYYEILTDSSKMGEINAFVNRLRSSAKKAFTAKTALILTYEDNTLYGQSNYRVSFQGTIASNGLKTYGIFIYKRLEKANGFVGYYDKSCGDRKQFLDTTNAVSVLKKSNVEIPGVYVYELSCS